MKPITLIALVLFSLGCREEKTVAKVKHKWHKTIPAQLAEDHGHVPVIESWTYNRKLTLNDSIAQRITDSILNYADKYTGSHPSMQNTLGEVMIPYMQPVYFDAVRPETTFDKIAKWSVPVLFLVAMFLYLYIGWKKYNEDRI